MNETPNNTQNKKDNLLVIVLSYIFWIVGLIILSTGTTYTKDEKFQMAQGVTLSLAYMILSFGSILATFVIPFISLLVLVGYIIILVQTLTKLKDDMTIRIPVIGDMAEKIFGNMINKK